MLKSEFLDKLSLVSPALSQNALVPVMTRYWFTGEKLIACGDQITIATDFKTDFTGSLPSHIADLLTVSRAANIDIEVKGEKLVIKSTNATFSVELRPAAEFEPFLSVIPKLTETPEKLVPLDESVKREFTDALTACMRSVANDTSHPECLGITVSNVGSSEGKETESHFYSTSGTTISRAILKTPKFLKHGIDPIILPELFCNQAISCVKRAESAKLEVKAEFALLQTNEAFVFCRVIESEHPLDFEKILDRYIPGGNVYVDIPDAFRNAIDRATVVTEGTLSRPCTHLEVKNGLSRLKSSTERGEVQDLVRLTDHPDVKTKLNPKLIKEGLGGSDALFVAKECIILASKAKNHIYVVSAVVE